MKVDAPKNDDLGLKYREAEWQESLRMGAANEAVWTGEAANRTALLASAATGLIGLGIDLKAVTKRQAEAYDKILASLAEFTADPGAKP